jgi:hypothetical protein
MDSAARQWFLVDRDVAHTVGPCAGTVRAVLEETKSAKGGGR